MSNPTTFFESTQSITERLAELNNFTWPTVAALWNLRWQVHGYVAVTGKKEAKELHERFVAGSGVTTANLKIACIETSWEDQQQQFARFLLFELCGLFEAWLEDVVGRAVPGKKGVALKKALQFPSGNGAKLTGLAAGIAVVRAERSVMMQTEILPTLKQNPKNSWINIESLLRGYRYFKECRNAFMHQGGKATQSCADAHGDFVQLPLAALYYKRAPLAPAVIAGNRLNVALHDVVGLSNIVHRLVITLDAMLATTKGAEREMLLRLRRAKNRNPFLLSRDPAKRQKQIGSRLGAANLPKARGIVLLEPWFYANRLAGPPN